MLTAIITDLTDARRLSATLAALAPAAVDGLVREALLVDVGASAETREAAEDAGARLILASGEAEGLAAACAASRGAWLLVLPCGARLESRWEPAVRRHVERHPLQAGRFDLALDADGPSARVSEAFAKARAALGGPDPRAGLLTPQRLLAGALGGTGQARREGLGRRMGPIRSLGVRLLIEP
jgi:hypothetical protein